MHQEECTTKAPSILSVRGTTNIACKRDSQDVDTSAMSGNDMCWARGMSGRSELLSRWQVCEQNSCWINYGSELGTLSGVVGLTALFIDSGT